MARKTTSRKTAKKPGLRARGGAFLRRVLRWLVRGVFWGVVVMLVWVLAYRWINPPTTIYIEQERARLGSVAQTWVDLEDMAPVMARAAVAAEDANFCLHWGFDVEAIREAIEDGSGRGASTISQQVVKNAFLWQGRSWVRKAMEAALTPVMETLWPKRRVIEIYLNVAEFDEGVFGVGAASQHYFGRDVADLTARQAGLLAAILPSPKTRSAARPTDFVSRRANSVADGAATILADGRADCFED
ncbi:monofunctional biosynthetic peptidoglycan transglycosylase [Jannaschia pohangensis]|uniref:Biosynthetic peptidoglycan transglycosylase n=1 Tax=Jannaschia pohangensis TaxID=390807 RepID=A0A1I3TCJ9_9RHOB|nr:monofunctional biosynthetic peptidoglycan transglycosylase [Jannaschia pohangensis]SFJ68222.1 monofunctional biosynthetic peptidoglycan transglycosylase [Jannaschia pohangensis]